MAIETAGIRLNPMGHGSASKVTRQHTAGGRLPARKLALAF